MPSGLEVMTEGPSDSQNYKYWTKNIAHGWITPETNVSVAMKFKARQTERARQTN